MAAITIPAAMRLKYLTLNGYKTFASKMTFEFGEGITCIIGPNGSGKSNIADGIRWALGEQQFSLLRGKKTEDMIFSGSTRRPRASMAEVRLTFDNSDDFFPIEFTEIELGRRAYRDGANEYVLNGNRVRLRDVADLLAHSGLAERTYTVIGQGLVDEALAQKPEERRALFEEAAGIVAYRDRREDALRKLEETRHNLERARDILTEITPRLKQLERQSERARQYQTLAAELESHTRVWLSYHYHVSKKALEAMTLARDEAQREAAEALGAVNQMDEEAAALRAERIRLQSQLAEAQPRRDVARQTAESATRNLAVMRERAAALEQQLQNAQRELEQHALTLSEFETRSAEAASALAAAQAIKAQRQLELDSAQQSASERQAERAVLEQRRIAAQQRLISINAEMVAAQSQIGMLQARQGTLRQAFEATTERIAQHNDQRESTLDELNRLNETIERDTARAKQLAEQHAAATHTLETARAELTAAQSALAAAEAEEKLTSRISLFAEMRAQQSTDDLAALASSAELPSVCGTLGSLIHIAPDDQKAVEAALGDWLKAIVFAPRSPDSTHGLNRVRAWLTEQAAGRLGVIAVNVLREMDAERENNDRTLAEHARANHARTLVESISAPDWLKPALRIIAGRAFIARDLDAAREFAAQLPDGSLCVTKDGEVAHAIGTLSLPAGARSPIILGAQPAGEDAFGELDFETAQANRQQAALRRDSAQKEFDAARRALDAATRERDAFEREATASRNARDDVARSLARIEESLAALAGDIEQTGQEINSLDAQIQQLSSAHDERRAAPAQAQQALADVEQQLHDQLAGGWLDALNAAHVAVAAAAAAALSAESLQQERIAAHTSAIAQREARAQRVSEFAVQHEAAQRDLLQLTEAATLAQQALQDAEAAIAPLQSEIASIELKLNELDDRKREAERTLRERESRLNAAMLDLARHEDELQNLRDRAADLLVTGGQTLTPEIGEETNGERERAQPVDDRALLESLPVVEQLSEGLEQRVAQLRNQIRRLGAINFEAQAEFEELQKRHAFIAEQSEDLEKASASLQQVIGELNDVMKATFRQTFDAIATAFQSTFKILFSGGQAKLTLINPENIDECGVDIQAQPPGKRPQSLALLSGGERSLTATALLFAILQVKPTPFCVLDEVDAALDEANIGRFRSMLENLSEQTQFILITHNRRTVEAANTIYGISMGADGTSTALSLRLEELN